MPSCRIHNVEMYYNEQTGYMECPECDYRYKPPKKMPTYDQLVKELKDVKLRNRFIERFLDEFAEYGDEEKDFQKAAKRLIRSRNQ